MLPNITVASPDRSPTAVDAGSGGNCWLAGPGPSSEFPISIAFAGFGCGGRRNFVGSQYYLQPEAEVYSSMSHQHKLASELGFVEWQ